MMSVLFLDPFCLDSTIFCLSSNSSGLTSLLLRPSAHCQQLNLTHCEGENKWTSVLQPFCFSDKRFESYRQNQTVTEMVSHKTSVARGGIFEPEIVIQLFMNEVSSGRLNFPYLPRLFQLPLFLCQIMNFICSSTFIIWPWTRHLFSKLVQDPTLIVGWLPAWPPLTRSINEWKMVTANTGSHTKVGSS